MARASGQGALAEKLLKKLDGPRRAVMPPKAVLDEELGRVMSESQRTWPKVTLSPDAFADQLAQALNSLSPAPDAISKLAVTDLFLARACAEGDHPAVTVLRGELLADLGASLKPLGVPAVDVPDVASEVCAHVLEARDGRLPRIADYRGRGSLKNWLHVSAARLALTKMRRGRREVPSDDAILLASEEAGPDPAVDFLRTRYQKEFSDAFREALRSLTARERTLLRQHYLDEVSAERIAALNKVHRATATRWLADARQALLGATRDGLAKRLGIPRLEVDSLIRQVQSNLQLSLHRYLT